MFIILNELAGKEKKKRSASSESTVGTVQALQTVQCIVFCTDEHSFTKSVQHCVLCGVTAQGGTFL